jgi:WD40 repeat protein
MPDATVLIFDVDKGKQVRIMRGHTSRVSSLSWSSSTLTSAGGSGAIMNSDVRQKMHLMSMLEYHSKAVCGLTWSREHDYLASGGADHLVALWDHRCALNIALLCNLATLMCLYCALNLAADHLVALWNHRYSLLGRRFLFLL